MWFQVLCQVWFQVLCQVCAGCAVRTLNILHFLLSGAQSNDVLTTAPVCCFVENPTALSESAPRPHAEDFKGVSYMRRVRPKRTLLRGRIPAVLLQAKRPPRSLLPGGAMGPPLWGYFRPT